MSRTISTNCGSADSLNVSTRWDRNPKVCHMREMVALESQTASAIVRVLHCVVCGGGASRVRVMMSTTRSSVTVRGVPGRGSSAKPSSHFAPKPLAPPPDTIPRVLNPGGHCSIREPLGTGQHHAGSQVQPPGRFRPTRPRFQRSPSVVRQGQCFLRTSSAHATK